VGLRFAGSVVGGIVPRVVNAQPSIFIPADAIGSDPGWSAPQQIPFQVAR
jgi:hypothetical protein